MQRPSTSGFETKLPESRSHRVFGDFKNPAEVPYLRYSTIIEVSEQAAGYQNLGRHPVCLQLDTIAQSTSVTLVVLDAITDKCPMQQEVGNLVGKAKSPAIEGMLPI